MIKKETLVNSKNLERIEEKRVDLPSLETIKLLKA